MPEPSRAPHNGFGIAVERFRVAGSRDSLLSRDAVPSLFRTRVPMTSSHPHRAVSFRP